MGERAFENRENNDRGIEREREASTYIQNIQMGKENTETVCSRADTHTQTNVDIQIHASVDHHY